MRKKYLSALLFGALLFASAGTFTSCKDYDDDINNLQNQITANADAIKALQELVNNGDYVTKVAKNADGNLVFTFSKSGDQVITLDEEQVGDVLSINAETGELIKNGEPTGWFATKNEEKEQQNCIKVGEDGCWQLLQDDGTYKSTNIPVSGVTAVQNTETKQWTLTIVDAQGNSQQVVIPSAASVMQDLELMGWATAEDASEDLSANVDGNPDPEKYKVQNTDLNVKYAYVKAITYDGKETTWSAQKDVTKGQVLTTLAPTNTKLVARVAPADLDLSGMNFTLQDSKGNKLPIALKTSEAFTGTLTRAASGISYIPMDITTDTYKSTQEYSDLFNKDALYSLVEESGARSTYGQFNITATPVTVREQSVKTVGGKEIQDGVYAVDVNTPNKLTFGPNPEYVYDYYVEAKDQAVANLFNVSIDKKNGTFTVGKLADQITTTTFTLYVYALHIDGTIYRSEIVIKPSRKIVSEAVLAAGEQVIKQSTKADGTAEMANFMKFEVSLDEMFNNMSASDKEKWTSETLGANAEFNITEVAINGTKATAETAAPENYYTIQMLDAKGNVIENAKDYYKAVSMRVYAKYKSTQDKNKALLSVGKEYSLTINFQNKNTNGEIGVLNTVKLTYTPTLPALSDYMVKHPSFWSDNTLRGISQVDNLTFATKPVSQILSYTIEDGFKTLGSIKAADKMDITFSLADNKVDNAEFVTVDKDGKVVSYTTTAGVASKQYGKEFTVNVNATYLDAYTYSEDALKAQSFKMVVLSPVYEGSIAAETTLEVEATAGAKLSMADIIAQNYNKQRYSLYLSKVLSDNKVIDVDATHTANIFDYAAIKSVEVTSGDEKVFTVVNPTPSAATWDATSKSVVPGTVEISTKEISNDTETYIKVKVTDVWGYEKEVEIPLTIKMAK
ncbi:hypothetical protein [Bacteroides ilei]|uniref:hypothetical protein n=1 Tax=Bacteroides ilei TaxID=1907658 RepID=UPI000B091C14|nr:hypothetical protein [Bacteroides ilei]